MKEKTNVLVRQILPFCVTAFIAVIGFTLTACGGSGGSSSGPGFDPNSIINFTITFDSNGGSAVAPIIGAAYESKTFTEFPIPTKASNVAGFYKGTTPGYTFVGWEKPDGTIWNFATDKVTGDITLTAVWTAPSAAINLAPVQGNNIIEKSINYMRSDTTSDYNLILGEDITTDTITHNIGVTLTIISDGDTERKITTTGGSVFVVDVTNSKLVIDGYVTLQGKTSNTAAVVQVKSGAALDLKGNAKITGNSSSSQSSGISNAGTITISDHVIISGNTSSTSNATAGGGGIYSSGTIIMNGGSISDNKVVRNGGSESYIVGGGGVYIAGGTFTMNGGEICANTAQNTYSVAAIPANPSNSGTPAKGGKAYGGGVYIAGGSFSISTGAVKVNIRDNIVTVATGGSTLYPQVYKNSGTFTVSGTDATSF